MRPSPSSPGGPVCSRSLAPAVRNVRPSGRGLALELLAHRPDDLGVIGLAEDRAARDEGVGAGGGDARDVVGLDAAIDFEPNVAPARVDAPADLLDLAQRRL